MSFNKKVSFPDDLKGFSVRAVSPPSISFTKAQESLTKKFEEGKQHATDFYLSEIESLKNNFIAKQHNVLEKVNERAEQTLGQLYDNLPDLVLEIVQKIIPSIELSGADVEKIVRSLIGEIVDEDETLEVFLCHEDLKLLKAMGKKHADQEQQTSESSEVDDGFASAISGIFDNLDGDDAVLPDLPRVKFFEDATLTRGDCQVKSKFGLLDGRIATKLRKVKEELTGND